MSDYETKKAEVLKLREEAMAVHKEWARDVEARNFAEFAAKYYPLPKREPLVVHQSSPMGVGYAYRVKDGVAQCNGNLDKDNKPDDGFWGAAVCGLATMRALVADADAQERGE